MLPLNCRVEDNSPAVRDETHPEIDVFDGRLGESDLIKPAKREEDLSADCPEAGPKGCRGTGTPLMNVVVKEVPEIGNHAGRRRIVVIGSEDCGEIRVEVECTTDSQKRIRVDFDIRVDEYEDIAACLTGADISGLTGAGGYRCFDNDQLLRRLGGCMYRGD
jgi:hypothetical protein